MKYTNIKNSILSYFIFMISASMAHGFTVIESSVNEIHDAIESGETTCVEVIRETLELVEMIDSNANDLNIFISINSNAIAEAQELDQYYQSGGKMGKLHCIPVAVKDNINTSSMPTTGGALANNLPYENAFIVNKLLDEGALVIGKANLHEYAFGYEGFSLLGGQTRNVYDMSKGPGGSSSGTASSVAASLATIGIGTDTGGSIRVPSSVQSLIGLRPSLRLISQSGIMPLAPFQDTAGPICRTVRDCAILLEVLVGYDKGSMSNQRESFSIESKLISESSKYNRDFNIQEYSKKLDEKSLEGAKVAVVYELFGDLESDENRQVQYLMNKAVENFKTAGALVEPVKIPDLETITNSYSSLSAWQFAGSLTAYLESWPSTEDGHLRSFSEVFEMKLHTEAMQFVFDKYAEKGKNPEQDPEYVKNTVERPDYVRPRIQQVLDEYDVIIYPTITGVAGELGGNPTSTGKANRLSPFSGFPALTMPIGFAKTKQGTELPVGLEILGQEFDEMTLLNIAYAFQSKFPGRKMPPLIEALK